MIEGVDYSTPRPPVAGLVAAGKRFVCRYGGPGTTDKHIDAAEVAALHGAGIAIVANAEGTARGLMGGPKVGVSWAQSADAHFRRLGMPDDRPIYFSADWDVQPVEWPTLRAALVAAGETIGPHRVGIYGGRRAVSLAQQDDAAAWFWQTYAWSGSPTVWVAGTHIQQYRNGVTVAGADCDLDRALTVDYGQWKGTPMLDLDTVIPGTATPPYHDKDRTLGEIIMDVANWRAVWYGEKAPPPGTPLARVLAGEVTLTDGQVAMITGQLKAGLGDVLADTVDRIGLVVRPHE